MGIIRETGIPPVLGKELENPFPGGDAQSLFWFPPMIERYYNKEGIIIWPNLYG